MASGNVGPNYRIKIIKKNRHQMANKTIIIMEIIKNPFKSFNIKK